MNRYYYDLHIHSCLSPCADDDNTPNNLAGMGMLAGLGLMALTDHNSAKNCPAFFKAAEKVGIIPVAGMELETSEDVHVVCLFPTLEDALDFDEVVASRRLPIKNKPEVYGEQTIMDEDDNVIGSEELLLVVATTIPLDEVCGLCGEHNGVCYPAHVDRQSNGIISILGDIPPDLPFSCAELHDLSLADELSAKYPTLSRLMLLSSSDAHRLEDINDARHYIELASSPDNPDAVRKELIERLKRGRV